MNDQDTITAAYADALKGLYKVLLSSYVTAAGNAALEQHAGEAFKAGVAIARKARDAALGLVH